MSNSSPTFDLPAIDVVIPAFNCSDVLERCLSRLKAQDYYGQIRIIVVDGGSSDGTAEIAAKFGAQVFINSGMYGTGLNGARHFGENVGSAPYVWILDSDNLLVESSAARDMIRPFLDDPGIQITIPETAIDPYASSFNNWISLVEIENVNQMKRVSTYKNGYYVIVDMFYGITNASIIKREALESAGGYDSDLRLLRRLRRLGLSKGAIVPTAHFYHNQVKSAFEFYRKWNRRIVKFGSMADEELKSYFVEYPVSVEESKHLTSGTQSSLLSAPVQAIASFLKTGNTNWLWGTLYPFIMASIIIRHPVHSRNVYGRFL